MSMCRTCKHCDVEKAQCHPEAEEYKKVYLLDEDDMTQPGMCDLYEGCLDNDRVRELLLNLKRLVDSVSNMAIKLSSIRTRIKNISPEISIGYAQEMNDLTASLGTYLWAVEQYKDYILEDLVEFEKRF